MNPKESGFNFGFGFMDPKTLKPIAGEVDKKFGKWVIEFREFDEATRESGLSKKTDAEAYPCSEKSDNWKEPGETEGPGADWQYGDLMCSDVFDNVIKGSRDAKEYSFVRIAFERCKETGAGGNKVCASPEDQATFL